ncbi:MAG TPA: glycoside hydrolase family 15 protein, partial [Bdellovibrionota bacterium]|nr:glycoside hydrolase family 15 protein [Bdellovibrionota bacterium]
YSQDSAEFSGMLELLKNEADSYLKRVQYHAAPDGSLSEQMNRYVGYMQGAENLTWNYASVLSAISARDQAARHSSLD